MCVCVVCGVCVCGVCGVSCVFSVCVCVCSMWDSLERVWEVSVQQVALW